jgi:hypothetical protein
VERLQLGLEFLRQHLQWCVIRYEESVQVEMASSLLIDDGVDKLSQPCLSAAFDLPTTDDRGKTAAAVVSLYKHMQL